ncbi:unnamed protein product, partial [Prorocentrum cordatum]
MDQCSIGRSAMFFAAQKRKLLVLMSWDIYHRCWNDVLGAAGKTSRLRRSILSLTHVCNIPYGPWSESKFFASRKEFFAKFLSTSTIDSEWFQTAADEIASDRGMASPTSRADMEDMMRVCAEAELLQKKGKHVKKARWFSLFAALKDLMADWALLREAYRYYHILFHGKGEEEFVEEMLHGVPAGTAPKDYRQELRELKQNSNGISLGAKLLTSELKQDMTILYSVVEPYWYHFGTVTETKKNADENRMHYADLATSGWTSPLRSSLTNALAGPRSLRLMGVLVGPQGDGALSPETLAMQRSTCAVATKFACELAGTRCTSSSEHYASYPGSFAAILADGVTAEAQLAAVNKFRADWATALRLEKAKHSRDDAKEILSQVEWIEMPANRIIMQMFDRPLDATSVDQDGFDMVWDAFSTFGDSLIIENTNNLLRRMTMGQLSDVPTAARRHHQCITSTLLQERGPPYVDIAGSVGEVSADPLSFEIRYAAQPIMTFVYSFHDWQVFETEVAPPCVTNVDPPRIVWQCTSGPMSVLRFALLRKIDLTTAMLKLVLAVCHDEHHARKKGDLVVALVQHVFAADCPKEFTDALIADILHQPTAEELEETEITDPVVECLGMLDEKNVREFEAMALAAKRKQIKDMHGIKRKRDVFTEEAALIRKDAVKTLPDWWDLLKPPKDEDKTLRIELSRVQRKCTATARYILNDGVALPAG